MGLSSKAIKLEVVSSLTDNMIFSPSESRSNLQEIIKLSIKKLSFGKLLSISVSEIIKISSLLFTCVAKSLNLFLIELMFK